MKTDKNSHQLWPKLPYQAFKSTAHLLHMGLQTIGKLKLYTPFEPQWANAILYITSRGLTTGLIPYQSGAFSVDELRHTKNPSEILLQFLETTYAAGAKLAGWDHKLIGSGNPI